MMGRTVVIDSDRRLAAALLLRAVKDAQSDDPALAVEARRWLIGRGAFWAELALNIPQERLMYWVDRLSALPYEQLTMFDGLV